MRSFNYCRVLLFLTLFITLSSHAANYAWTNSNGPGNVTYGSVSAACDAGWNYLSESYKQYQAGASRTITKISDIRFSCSYDPEDPLVSATFFWYANRVGDSCPEGATYNPDSGECIAPDEDPCLSKSGESLPFTKGGPTGDGYGDVIGGYLITAQSACFGGCAVNTADQSCKSRIVEDSAIYACKGTGSFTGQSCSTSGSSTEIQAHTPDNPAPDPIPQSYKDESPCNYSSGSSGEQSCTSSKTEGKEGQHCGTVNGVQKCIPIKPTENGIQITTTVKSSTDSDGNTTTTKTDTATSTKCTGIGECTSTSATTTTVTKTNSSGHTTSVTDSCTGDACPDENTNPDGDGDGFGDCFGGDCGEGEGGGSHDWYEPGEDTYASVIEGFAGRVSDMPAVAGVDNFLTFTPSGTCPVYTVDVWIFYFRIDQFCSGEIPWDLIRAVILGSFAFFAFRIAFL